MNSPIKYYLAILQILLICGCSSATDLQLAKDGTNESIDKYQIDQSQKLNDWPQMFGPRQDSTVYQDRIDLRFNENGPKELWRIEVGEGYSSVSIVGDDLILFHRKQNEEIVECIDVNTQKTKWKSSKECFYVDRYGYSGGPRCQPIIRSGYVYTYGVTGICSCWDLQTGKEIWSRDLVADYKAPDSFFGVGAAPLLVDDLLIVNVGGKDTNAGIVALNITNGKTVWTATDHGASYCTPVSAKIHGNEFVFVFTQDGLVSMEPKSGAVDWEIPFRSRSFESVNATSPLVVDDLVLVSSSYNTGTKCVRIQKDRTYEEVWEDKRGFGSHISNMIEVDGFVYGFNGRHENGCTFECFKALTGETQWKEDFRQGRSSFLRIGNRFLVWGERGTLASFDIDPQKAKLVSLVPDMLLRFPTWTQPAVADRKLYLRNEEYLVCYDLELKE